MSLDNETAAIDSRWGRPKRERCDALVSCARLVPSNTSLYGYAYVEISMKSLQAELEDKTGHTTRTVTRSSCSTVGVPILRVAFMSEKLINLLHEMRAHCGGYVSDELGRVSNFWLKSD